MRCPNCDSDDENSNIDYIQNVNMIKNEVYKLTYGGNNESD